MLGLLLLYFIGKNYHRLALEHQKKSWPWVVAGIVFYYLGTLLLGALLGLYCAVRQLDFDSTFSSQIGLSLIALPAGLISTALFYWILKKKWEKQALSKENNPDILDDGV